MSKKPTETLNENLSTVDLERGGANRQAMLGKVFAPSIALMVTGVLNVISALYFLLNSVFAFARNGGIARGDCPHITIGIPILSILWKKGLSPYLSGTVPIKPP
jgi:hypothetical protein